MFTSCLFFLSLLLFPFCVHAEESIITAVLVNQEPMGDYFVVLLDDGDFLLRPADLAAMGFRERPVADYRFEGEDYVLLGAVAGVDFSFDENTLSLLITAAPELLEKSSLDLSIFRRGNVYRPRENSFFLNYGIDYATGGGSLDFENLSISNELGLRFREVLLLAASNYRDTPNESRMVRLNTSLVWDHEEELQRYVAGDFIATSGFLGSTVNMGGLSFSKLYRIDPYFINYPLFDFTGQLTLPSEIELYVDGVMIRSQRFAPGEFELMNYQGVRGAQDVEVVIRDSLGREQRAHTQIYSTDKILRQGLHEYSYNLGFPRRNFGVESNDYDDLAFSALHRYGVSDQFNLGGRGELQDGLANVGLEASLVSRALGLLRVEGSASLSGGQKGHAGLLSYDYQTPRFSSQMALRYLSSGYRTLGEFESSFGRRLNLLAKMSYVTSRFGSFSLGYAYNERESETDRQVINASWSHRVYKNLFVRATLAHVDETESGMEGTINFTWNFGNDRAISADYQHDRQGDLYAVEARQNTPAGEGTGWSVRLERATNGHVESKRGSSFVQHNGRHAIVRSDFGIDRTESETDEFMRFALAGALTHVGDTFGLTRPVRDSFAQVSIGDIENVRVYVNGQTAGHTDRQGQVIIPDLNSYYENQVSFEDKDVPLDYLMPNVRLTVSTPLNSGSCLNFPIAKYQAFTGVLLQHGTDGDQPLANARLTLKMPGKDHTFWTSRDGEFYIDSQQDDIDINSMQGCDVDRSSLETFLPAGHYPLVIRQAERVLDAEITIPSSDETFVEMGHVILKTTPVTAVRVAAHTPTATAEQQEFSSAQMPSAPDDLTPAPRATPPPISDEMAATPLRHVIHFPFDSSTPLVEDLPILAAATKTLQDYSELTVRIEGHASQEGDADYNQQLGMRRVLAIQNYFIDAGIAPTRIKKTTSFGEQQPVCKGNDEACLKQNRRTIIIVVR